MSESVTLSFSILKARKVSLQFFSKLKNERMMRVGYTLTFSFSKSTLHTIQVLGFNLQHRTWVDGVMSGQRMRGRECSVNSHSPLLSYP